MLFACFAFMLMSPQGEYSEVTDAEVISMKLNHYFTADKKSHKPDFVWKFTKEGFVLKDGDGKIPAYLAEKLLPDGLKANEIKGKWKLDKGNLVLSSITAGGQDILKDAKVTIYKTAPTVIRIGEVQHVFAIAP
jgi:hypothetical protein